jgi:hypothetical protein
MDLSDKDYPFNPKDWVFEYSSGFAGWRNKKTASWLYQSEFETMSKESPNKKRWFTVVTEHDRWSGPETLTIEEWDTQAQAAASAKQVNDKNTEPTAPEYYIDAVVSNDLNYTQHKGYVDKRAKNEATAVVNHVAELNSQIDVLLQAVKIVAAGMGNLSLEQIGDAGVNGIRDGKARAIYLEMFVKTARDALTELGQGDNNWH